MMIKKFLVAVLLTSFGVVGVADDGASDSPSRKFEFSYDVAVNDVPTGAHVRVWFPIAKSTAHQSVEDFSARTPSTLMIDEEKTYGNKIGYFELTNNGDSAIKFDAKYLIKRSEAAAYGSKAALTEKEKALYLKANSLVPTDGVPLKLLSSIKMPNQSFAKGQLLYDTVESHMKYDKSKPGYGKGDSVWACNSKTGNCTDFHSLFISLARSQSVPAKFEIGFPLPSDKTSGTVGGYHCWAWFHAEDHGWVPVDISEADKHPELKNFYFGKLTADRVAFSHGRDIQLTPQSATQSLNYFVYPHIEVNGKIWPKEKTKLNFSFVNK